MLGTLNPKARKPLSQILRLSGIAVVMMVRLTTALAYDYQQQQRYYIITITNKMKAQQYQSLMASNADHMLLQ